MDVVSTYKFARISARKARDVGREIQGLPVSAALDILAFTPRKGADLFEKTMKAALADAENNFELDLETLFVKEAVVGEGPTFKRFKPRARGSASAIRKRTSHIRVVLSDDYEQKEKTKRIDVSPDKKKSAGKARSKKKDTKPKATKAAAADKGRVYDEKPDNADDLTELSGVGAKLADKLNSEGIYTFDQIANWSEENVAAFDSILSLDGRIEKEDWVAEAKKLAKG